VSDGVYTNGPLQILEDVSFAGHRRWTDPAPTSGARAYRVDFPVLAWKRYLVRVAAKRFAFDKAEDQLFSDIDHVFSVDVRP
jgi:hypothetical protein